MRDFSLLDSAIDEMERVLLGNKPREAEEIYLQNAIDLNVLSNNLLKNQNSMKISRLCLIG